MKPRTILTFKNTYATEYNPYVQKHIRNRVQRDFKRGNGALSEIRKLMTLGDFFTSDGKVKWPILNINDERFHQFFKRLARALIYHRYNESFFEAEIGWSPNLKFPDELYRLDINKYPHGRIGGVLSYVIMNEYKYSEYWILVEFYDSLRFLIKVKYEENK